MMAWREAARHLVRRVLRPISERWVYTARYGPAKGMRVKGGFSFLPLRTYKEDEVLEQLRFDLAGKTIYDIGANVGLLTLFFAREVGPSGLVVAFEPVPPLLNRLRENVSLNNLANVRILDLALGDCEMETEIHFAPDAIGLATLRKDLAQEYSCAYRFYPYRITVVPLDKLVEMQQLPSPHLLKIDVEGFELQVLRGARSTLAKAHPRSFLELHGNTAAEKHEIWMQIFDLLSSFDYDIHTPAGEQVSRDTVAEKGPLWLCR